MEDARTCPYCAEKIRIEAVKCRFCGSRVDRGILSRSWYRRRDGRKLGGVCVGLAEELGVSVAAIRVAFVLSLPLGLFWGLVIYAALWLIMPLEPEGRLPEPPPGGSPGGRTYP